MAFHPAPVGRTSLGHPCTAALPATTRNLPLQLRASAHPERSGSSNGEASVASPFLPTRVRVQHDTYIRASRAAVWSLMQEITPAPQWQQVAVVLATLESIYGVEYQGFAEQLLTAFQQANRHPTVGQGAAPPSRVASPTARPNHPGAYTVSSGVFDSEQLQFDHLGPSGLPLTAAAADNRSETRRQNGSSSSAGSRSSSSSSSSSSKMNGSSNARGVSVEQQPLLLQGVGSSSNGPSSSISSSGSSSNHTGVAAAKLTQATAAAPHEEDAEQQPPPQDAEAAAAAAADTAFMQLLLLLAQRAGFVPLSERDVALGVSLNTDFLWQLFVKVSDEQLDGQLVSGDILAGAGIGSTAVQLPKETQQLLVLRRGYSSEQQRGRWLIQKLDYLQLLLVKRAVGGLSRLGTHILQQAQDFKTQSRQQQQQQQQRAVHGKTAAKQERPMSSSSRKGNSKARNDAVQKSRRANSPRTDSFGRPYPDAAADEGANSSSIDSSSSTHNEGFAMRLGLKWGGGSSRSSSRNGTATPNSSGGSSSSKGQSDTTQAAADSSHNSSNNAIEGSEGGVDHTGEDLQPSGQADITQQQQQQQRQQHGLMGRLSARVEQSVNNVLHTLSDWGVIPRMDVTPLEQFDEVYPLSEPSRFRPLYIEKATLPDIMDPVIEPRLAWLGSRDRGKKYEAVAGSSSMHRDDTGHQATDTDSSSEGSAVSGVGDADRSTSASVSSSSSSTLLQTLLQPVEIVEPTFRQLLVVYRRKPRQERWRHMWSQLTGQRVQAAATRRSGIQLQVYRDIPLPSWQVVFPDKLLQFRPLDLLRLDLFALGGIGAAFAQAKYNSFILELLTLASLTVWGTRLVLGYMRMGDRYKSIVAQLLAERTVAGGEGGLEYLATAAGLQQFKQAALAYVLLAAAARPLEAEEVAVAAEKLLQQHLQLQVCFNAAEALNELRRFGLLVEKQTGTTEHQRKQLDHQQQQAIAWSGSKTAVTAEAASIQPAPAGTLAVASAAAAAAVVAALAPAPPASVPQQQQQQQQQHRRQVYTVLNSRDAQQVLQAYWAGLLRARVQSILRDV